MDKLTHISLTNCIKELDSLEKLVQTEEYSYEEVAEAIKEISWNLSLIFNRRRYNSDEFQLKLRDHLKSKKKRDNKVKSPSKDWRAEQDDDVD